MRARNRSARRVAAPARPEPASSSRAGRERPVLRKVRSPRGVLGCDVDTGGMAGAEGGAGWTGDPGGVGGTGGAGTGTGAVVGGGTGTGAVVGGGTGTGGWGGGTGTVTVGVVGGGTGGGTGRVGAGTGGTVTVVVGTGSCIALPAWTTTCAAANPQRATISPSHFPSRVICHRPPRIEPLRLQRSHLRIRCGWRCQVVRGSSCHGGTWSRARPSRAGARRRGPALRSRETAPSPPLPSLLRALLLRPARRQQRPRSVSQRAVSPRPPPRQHALADETSLSGPPALQRAPLACRRASAPSPPPAPNGAARRLGRTPSAPRRRSSGWARARSGRSRDRVGDRARDRRRRPSLRRGPGCGPRVGTRERGRGRPGRRDRPSASALRVARSRAATFGAWSPRTPWVSRRTAGCARRWSARSSVLAPGSARRTGASAVGSSGGPALGCPRPSP